MATDRYYALARKRANMKIGFAIHTTVYLAVMVLLIFINVVSWSGYPWFLWPLGGWGFGLVIHGMVTFLVTSNGLHSWRKRLIDEELERARTSISE